ncbi:histidine kinase [Vogesella sp. LIG4]|uniref:sensor histidine kinase n=1 Tax=Vogesella sp. LIG4 TaxID=1192162 RepID=UPI0018D2D3E6|nr:histidine kinase [Vogesella sp. LIG4]
MGAITDVRGGALAILTPGGRFVSANKNAAALLGYPPKDLVGKLLIDMAPDDHQHSLQQHLATAMASALCTFSTVLRGRTGLPSRLILHQQAIAVERDGLESSRLTLFEEPMIIKTGAIDIGLPAESDIPGHLAFLTLGQEKERRRLSSELHDGMGQALALIKLMVEDSLFRLRQGQVDNAAQLLDNTVLRIRETIGDLRHICSDLYPLMMDRQGLPAALAALCRSIERITDNLVVDFDCNIEDGDIPEHLKGDMFRVAQEALNNAIKHASATEISLSLQRVAGCLVLTIQDNGIGYEVRPLANNHECSACLGLVGMQYRVESNGGQFSIHSPGRGGTLVSATWP